MPNSIIISKLYVKFVKGRIRQYPVTLIKLVGNLSVNGS